MFILHIKFFKCPWKYNCQFHIYKIASNKAIISFIVSNLQGSMYSSDFNLNLFIIYAEKYFSLLHLTIILKFHDK